MRVFRAVQCLLMAGDEWDRIYQTGAYIRTDLDKLGGNISIDGDMTLEYAADNIIYGLKREVINGVSYYTREYYAASATSTYFFNDKKPGMHLVSPCHPHYQRNEGCNWRSISNYLYLGERHGSDFIF